jgi:hypothetical protein
MIIFSFYLSYSPSPVLHSLLLQSSAKSQQLKNKKQQQNNMFKRLPFIQYIKKILFK